MSVPPNSVPSLSSLSLNPIATRISHPSPSASFPKSTLIVTADGWFLEQAGFRAGTQNDGSPEATGGTACAPIPHPTSHFLITELFSLWQRWVPSSDYMFCEPLNKLKLWFRADK